MARLPLEAMSVEEKLQAMESLWEDLCSRAEGVPSAPWHGDVLADREAAMQRGDESAEDWDAAKKRIMKDLT